MITKKYVLKLTSIYRTNLNYQFDQKLRDEAVAEMQAAIKSAQLRIQKQEVELASSLSPDDNDIMREEIADVKSMVEEMQGRVSSPILRRSNLLVN